MIGEWLDKRFPVSPLGNLVLRLLALQDEWRVTPMTMIHTPSGLVLWVGYGFWSFDVHDDDQVPELTFRDKLKIWPVANALRRRLRHGV